MGIKDNQLPLPVTESETTAQEHCDITLNIHQSGRDKENSASRIPQFTARKTDDPSDTRTDEGNAVAFPIMQAERYDSRRAELVTASANNSRRSHKPSESSGSSTSRIDNSISDGSWCEKSVVIEKNLLKVNLLTSWLPLPIQVDY